MGSFQADRLYELAEALPQIIWTADPDGTVDYLSQDFYQFTGLPPLDLRAGEWLQALHPDDRARTLEVWGEALAGESAYKTEFRLICAASGDYRWHLVSARPVRDAKGIITKWYGAAVDIDDRLRAEIALADAQRRSALILGAASDGIQGLDANGRITFQNAAGQRMLGLPRAEGHVGCWHRYIRQHRDTPPGKPSEDCPICMTLRDGRTRRVERERFFRKDGTPFTAEFTVSPMLDPASGKVDGAVVTFRDCTEEMLEAELQALEARVLAAVSAGLPLPAILTEVASTVDRLLPEVRASILLADDSGRLRHGAAPGLSDDYNLEADGLPIEEGRGSCGTAAFRRSQVIVADIRTDPLWVAYRHIAERFGLRACWSTPIASADGSLLGTFALYYRTPRVPQARDLAFINRIERFVCVAIERSRQREALIASENRYRSIFDLVPVSLWEEDWRDAIEFLQALRTRGACDLRAWLTAHPDDLREAISRVKVLDVNRVTLQMFDASSKAQLLASLTPLFASPDTHPGLIDKLASLAGGCASHEAEMRLRTLSGRRIDALTRLVFTEPAGGQRRALVSRMDITARNQAQERFRVVAQATSDVVWDLDLRENTLWFSEGLRLRFGHDPHGLTRDGFRALIHPADLERVLASANDCMRTITQGWELEYRLQRADGSYAEVLDRAFLLRDEAGQTIRVVGSIVDLSEQKRLEAQLRQSQRLDAVGQLTGGVAHDFNNLLTVILGNAEVLEEGLAEDDPRRSLASMIRNAAARSAELTSRLLSFARRQALDPRPVNVADVIDDMVPLLRRALGEQVEMSIAPCVAPWHAMVDAPQLENAVLNLCLNARDAMPQGGKLELALGNVSVDAAMTDDQLGVAAGDYLCLTVKDSGIGMDAETHTRAFEPFFTTKPAGKGSGLGLSMVYGFVRQSGGHIRIQSAPGAGTTVRLYLPRANGNPAPLAARDNQGDARGHEQILLVEDDALVRNYVESQLRALGYPVIACENGVAALAALQAGTQVELLLTDVVMPGGLDGAQLAERARALRPGLRVLFTSGYAENALVHKGRLDPGVQLLSKPYRRQQLAAKVREVLDAPPC
jgi:PAS domain S-box-containing protein